MLTALYKLLLFRYEIVDPVEKFFVGPNAVISCKIAKLSTV